MAFDRTNFERQAGGKRKRYGYKTTDAIATVTASGYFNSVATELDQFDVIEVISSTGGTPVIDLIFVTSANRAATVTTSSTEGVTTS